MNKYIVSIVSWIWMMLNSPNADAQVKHSQYKTINSQSLKNVLEDKDVREMSLEELQKAMLSYINEARIKHGLTRLQLYKSDIEQKHSEYLAISKEDEELTPEDHFDAQGKAFYTRAKNAKVPLEEKCRWNCKRVWENIASFESIDWEEEQSPILVKDIISSWLASPDHAANIYDASFDHMIVGHSSGNIVVWFVNLVDK